MKVKILRDTRVNLSAGTVVDVEEQEANKLLAFSVAEKVTEKKPAPKKAAKK